MSTVRRTLLVCTLVGSALGATGFLYARSRSADFGRHARVINAIGRVRHLNELLSQEVLAARFGLLNQYDPITATAVGLSDAVHDLPEVAGAVEADGGLAEAHRRLEESIAAQGSTVERFKTENAVLKNSLYYLPSVAHEVELGLGAVSGIERARVDAASRATQRVIEATLMYNLIGDEPTRGAHLQALAELQGRKPDVPPALHGLFESLLVHASVVAHRQSPVDRWVKQVVDGDVNDRLRDVEHAYHQRFAAAVTTSNQYRNILYAWSLALVLAVGAFGWLLRRLYADLEHRVLARTTELREALSALWGEMKLARKIQEALVPASPALRDSDMAATMKPAEDVGGDYYDVVRTSDAEWILIGDVSGHGVPAGLIMMMCHTAVRTVLQGNPRILPNDLLAIVNTVLTENIRQLGEDKYMTISAFRRERDGTVFFAGAHQDVFIYRAETDTVDMLPTAGVWLGIKDRIDDMLVTNRFHLAPGDVLVLYTDGIIEATRDGALFDTIGVRRVLDRARGKTAKQLLDALFSELEGFRVNDDATVLVMKQLPVSGAASQPKIETLQRRLA